MQDIYQSILRPILFSGLKVDPEWLHQRTIQALAWVSRSPSHTGVPWVWAQGQNQLQASLSLTDPRLQQTLWGQTFENPIGMAAGFDKDGLAVRAWPLLGFGFTELGTVTWQAQPGNPRPRLFRLVQDRAALNRMGFNNLGAEAMAVRLRHLWPDQSCPIPLGINLGKSKVTPLETAAEDYRDSFQALYGLGDYFVVNVSSPNTPGLRSLQAKAQLAPILEVLQAANSVAKPVLIKIAPDLAWEDIGDILSLVREYRLAGIIATNTTIQRTGLKTQVLEGTGNAIADEAGGISGAPLRQRATDVIRFIYQETQGQLPIIGVGGIFSADDAWEKITAGASLIQIYTGWIYEGPSLVKAILQGLLQKLEQHQLSNISQAIGLTTSISHPSFDRDSRLPLE